MGTPEDGIRAIETRYAGCHFRSRLEARWAVFFDELDIEWEYEPQGYEYEGWRYLPDFYLPALGCYVEVKGNADRVTDDYLAMLGHVGHFLPGVHSSYGTTRGLVLLGPIPRTDAALTGWSHYHLTHHKGLQIQSLVWGQGAADCAPAEITITYPEVIADDGRYYGPRQFTTDNMNEDDLPLCPGARRLWHPRRFARNHYKVTSAYDAARSARFEYGQVGAT